MSNFFSSIKTRLGSVPASRRERRILALARRFSTVLADNNCFLLCLNGDIFRSLRRTVNMVPYVTFASFAGWISLDFSGLRKNPERPDIKATRENVRSPNFLPGSFYQFRSPSTSRTALSWLILHISTFFIPFKSPPDQHSVHFQILANFFPRLPALQSSTIAIRLP